MQKILAFLGPYRRHPSKSLLGVVLACSLVIAPGLSLADGASKKDPNAKWMLKDPTQAKKVMASVQTFYDRTKSLEANFQQTYFHKVYKKKSLSKGKVLFKKPGKMRWDYAKPNGKIIASTGSQLRIYEPGEKTKKGRAPGTLIERKMSTHQLPMAFSFLTGVGRLDKDFRYRLINPAKIGVKNADVLELRPKKRHTHIDRLIFVVGQNKTRGVVKRVVIIDPLGNYNSLTFDTGTIRFNRKVNDRTFAFSPPKGTTVVEM